MKRLLFVCLLIALATPTRAQTAALDASLYLRTVIEQQDVEDLRFAYVALHKSDTLRGVVRAIDRIDSLRSSNYTLADRVRQRALAEQAQQDSLEAAVAELEGAVEAAEAALESAQAQIAEAQSERDEALQALAAETARADSLQATHDAVTSAIQVLTERLTTAAEAVQAP